MSRTPRTPRAKSGLMRPLGAMRLHHDAPPSVSFPINDPALHINQMQTSTHAAVDKQKDLQKERECKERERKLNDQIAALEKLVAQLRHQLKIKSEKCTGLEKDIALQAKEQEEKLAQCKAKHDITRGELCDSEVELVKTKVLMDTTVHQYEEKIKSIITEYQTKLSALQKSKDKELKEKEDKLDLLKRRMAASLGKNSQERQHQLEELKRDLMNQSQEARELQQKLKHIQIKSLHCDNCRKLEEKLEDKNLQLRLKERTIDELQGIGRKMKVQLTQQVRPKNLLRNKDHPWLLVQEEKLRQEGMVREGRQSSWGISEGAPPLEPPTSVILPKLEKAAKRFFK